MWSLGVVLYILCYKEVPFRTPKETLLGVLRLPISRPASLVQTLRRLLEPRPENRPTITQLLSSELFLEHF